MKQLTALGLLAGLTASIVWFVPAALASPASPPASAGTIFASKLHGGLRTITSSGGDVGGAGGFASTFTETLSTGGTVDRVVRSAAFTSQTQGGARLVYLVQGYEKETAAGGASESKIRIRFIDSTTGVQYWDTSWVVNDANK